MQFALFCLFWGFGRDDEVFLYVFFVGDSFGQ